MQAQSSFVSSKQNKSKRRSSKDKPDHLCQTTNRHACRIANQTNASALKYGHVTTFSDEQKTKEMPLHSQTVITATTLKSPSKSGGLRKKDLLRDGTKMTIVSSNGSHGMDKRLQVALYESGAMNGLVQYMKDIQDKGGDPFSVLREVPSTPSNLTKISSEEQLNADKDARVQSRARARQGRSEEEISADLGDDVQQWRLV